MGREGVRPGFFMFDFTSSFDGKSRFIVPAVIVLGGAFLLISVLLWEDAELIVLTWKSAAIALLAAGGAGVALFYAASRGEYFSFGGESPRRDLPDGVALTRALGRISEIYSETEDENVILQMTANIVGETMKADAVHIHRISAFTYETEYLHGWSDKKIKSLLPPGAEAPVCSITIPAINYVYQTRRLLESHEDDVNPAIGPDSAGGDYHRKMRVQSLLWQPFLFTSRGFYLISVSHVLRRRSWKRDELHFLGSVSDQLAIALRKIRLLNVLRERENALLWERALFTSGPVIVFRRLPDEDKPAEYVSGNVRQLGFSADQFLRGDMSYFSLIHPEDRDRVRARIRECAELGIDEFEQEYRLASDGGDERWFYEFTRVIRDNEGGITHFHGYVFDITPRKRADQQLAWQATHDSLTGLANRRRFDECLNEALHESRKRGDSHVLLYLDLDQFKLVNDTCGHIAGDELLKQLSGVLLTGNVKEDDVLARLGGDEFGLLLKNREIEQAKSVAENIRELVKSFRFTWGDRIFEVCASIGMIRITKESESPAQLMSKADMACYTAKELGRNRVHVYNENDEDMARRHDEMEWVSRLNLAFKENRFILYAQKIESLQGGENGDSYYEVLIRMKDENNAIVSPGEFLPSAERYNLMYDLDRWVIQTLFHFAQQNSAGKESGTRFSVNISGTSLGKDGLLEFIIGGLESHSLRPEWFCFEVTETAAVANFSRARRFISELRSLGCKFALDDFGSGHSSFKYLKNLPADYLKIDGSFIRDIENDPVSRGIAEAIIRVGHVMGLKTVAEYVENENTKQILKNTGVDFAQGFGVEKPRPLMETRV